jgi:hypothetical protein
MMNCSEREKSDERFFLDGNFGASVFLATYIGLYGLGIIVYFAFQFISDASQTREDEIPSEFFVSFHQINEQQAIYGMPTICLVPSIG